MDRVLLDPAVAGPPGPPIHKEPALAKIPPGVGPRFPQVVVLFGATGDLARRKLLPGLYHLVSAGFIPGCRVVGVSLDDIDAERFRQFARGALDEFFNRTLDESRWQEFAARLDYVPLAAGAALPPD